MRNPPRLSEPARFLERVHRALDCQDSEALRALSRERSEAVETLIAEEAGNPRESVYKRSMLDWAAQELNPWAVKEVLSWGDPLPNMANVLRLFMEAHASASPWKLEDKERLKRRSSEAWEAWEALRPLVGPEDATKVWHEMLDIPCWNDEELQSIMLAALIQAGADPLAPLPAPPLTCREFPDQSVSVSSLMVAWASGCPRLAEELLDLGADAWNPMPETAPEQWTLARAMGMDSRPWVESEEYRQFERDARDLHETLNTPESSWARLRAKVAQQRFESAPGMNQKTVERALSRARM